MMHGEYNHKKLQKGKIAGKYKNSLTMRCISLCVKGVGGNTLELRPFQMSRGLRKHQ